MVKNPSGEANCHAANQEAAHMEPTVYYYDHKNAPLELILSYVNLVHIFDTISVRSILILSSHLCLYLSGGLLPSDFVSKTMYAFLTSLMYTACCPLSIQQANNSLG